ncbi:MAG: thiamine-phosphate kinase [Actinomycetaceae bacterium]|nr:thiamine-phosphate kinase [Actinomycetaceae bacterium]MDU0970067.1 thiamine-phosphate kinase [Actinomycetaceae bacterium]
MPRVSDLGEDGVLARIIPRLGRGDATLVGPGDDCAVLRVVGDLVVTTDTLVEGQHFLRSWGSAHEVGERAAAQNLADVAAMGARPIALVVGLALPGDTDAQWVADFADGLNVRAQQVGAGVEGGDLTRSASEIVIGVTALGALEGRPPVLRDGARVGDAIVVAGTLGRSQTGLELYQAGHVTGAGQIDADDMDACAAALAAECTRIYRAPVPPLETAIAGAESLHAMMDISDSLARDASRMGRASGVTMALSSAAMAPFAQAIAPLDPWCAQSALRRVLTGGEDHGFLATCDPARIPAGFVTVGQVVAPREASLEVDGHPFKGTLGWESLP